MKQYIDYFTYQKKLDNILTFHLFEKEKYEEYLFETSVYQKYLELYQQILRDFKEFIRKYPIHDSLELGILYTYFLLPNGIFSLNNIIIFFIFVRIVYLNQKNCLDQKLFLEMVAVDTLLKT